MVWVVEIWIVGLNFVFFLFVLVFGSCFVNGREYFNIFDNIGYRFLGFCLLMFVLDSENFEDFKVVFNGDFNCDFNNLC